MKKSENIAMLDLAKFRSIAGAEDAWRSRGSIASN
jgi:hypothetical protein